MIQVGVSSEAVSAEQVAMKFALFAGVSPQTHLGQEYLQQRLPRLDFANGLVWPSFPLPIALGRRTFGVLWRTSVPNRQSRTNPTAWIDEPVPAVSNRSLCDFRCKGYVIHQRSGVSNCCAVICSHCESPLPVDARERLTTIH
jgi:hypothetical protein